MERDLDRAAQLYAASDEKGHPSGTCSLGLCYELGRGVATDRAKAAQLYRKAADAGDARAQCNLGYCYYQGIGVEEDNDQAFHWFDVPAFRRECQRILKPCGSVFLIWNVRADSGVNRAWQELLSAYCPDFKGFSAGLQKDDPRIGAFFVRGYAYKAFDNPLRYSREAFVKRCLSSSYSLRADNPAYGAYLAALEALFDRYAEKDALTVPNQSVVYFGAPA